jgi:hypothetical protein
LVLHILYFNQPNVIEHRLLYLAVVSATINDDDT